MGLDINKCWCLTIVLVHNRICWMFNSFDSCVDGFCQDWAQIISCFIVDLWPSTVFLTTPQALAHGTHSHHHHNHWCLHLLHHPYDQDESYRAGGELHSSGLFISHVRTDQASLSWILSWSWFLSSQNCCFKSPCHARLSIIVLLLSKSSFKMLSSWWWSVKFFHGLHLSGLLASATAKLAIGKRQSDVFSGKIFVATNPLICSWSKVSGF